MYVVKSIFDAVVQLLLCICNLSFTKRVFRDEMKIPLVLPFFKSGDDNTFNNKRPVSLLPEISKIVEKII